MTIVFTALTAMPPGLSLSADGKITGTPTASFSGSVQIRATDGVATATGLMQFNIALPQVPISSLIQEIKLSAIATHTLSQLTPPPIVQLLYTPTIGTVEVTTGPLLSALWVPTIESAIQEFSALFTPTMAAISQGGYDPAIATPLGTAGLTQIVNTGADDAFFAVPDIGFDLPIYGDNRRASLFVGSNSYVTFITGSTAYSGISETNPGMGLFIAAADRSWRSVWAGSDGPNRYRVRWEGSGSSSTSGPTTEFWEVTFFSDGAIMLVTGDLTMGGGYSAITDGLGGNSTGYTLTSNSSWVFEPSGAVYTVQVGSYTN